MPRIRTLKPEHRQHRKVGKLSHVTYRLWVGMILEADDEGRLICDPDQLRVVVFGYHHKVTTPIVTSSLRELESAGLIRLYTVDGIDYAAFLSWHDHQKIDHPKKSTLPEPSGDPRDVNLDKYAETEHSPNPREASRILANIRGGMEGKGSDRNGKEVNTLVCEFDQFWSVWPSTRRVKKNDALSTWRALNPDRVLCQTILAAVEAQKQGAEWQREGGRYIPHPHRWLAKRRWEDAPPAAQATLLTSKTEGNKAAAEAFLRRMGEP